MKHTLKNASVYSKGTLYLPGDEVDLPTAELVKLGEVEQGAESEQDDRTVSELTAALEAKQVEIPSGAKKADLLKLAQQHGV